MGDFDFRDLRTVEQIVQANPEAIPEKRLRWWIEQAEINGLASCLVRVGRTILIHEQKFNRWLRDRLGMAA